MKRSHLPWLFLLPVLAALVTLYTTSNGVGLAPDSYIYVSTARSLLGGHGASIPNGPGEFIHSAHFPPLYAGMLALGSLAASDPIAAAGPLNALLFGATVFLAGLAVYRLAGGSLAVALLAQLAVLSTDDLLQIHAQVWSEPPFFLFALAGLLLLSLYLPDRKPWRLYTAAAAFSLAFLVRYAGVALVLAGGLCVLALPDWGRLRRRVASAPPASSLGQQANDPPASALGIVGDVTLKPLALLLAISCTPVGLWMLYNRLAAGSLADRELAFHPVTSRTLIQGAHTVAGWFFPVTVAGLAGDILSVVLALGEMALLALAVWSALRGLPRLQPGQASPLPYLLFILVYAVFLLVSLSFFDAQTGLDGRILSPVLLTLLILVPTGLRRWLPTRPLIVRIPLLAAAAALLGATVFNGMRMISSLAAGEHKGYSEAVWKSSRLLQQIDSLPEDTLIYSNGHDLIYLLTGRPAIGLPRMWSPNSMRTNPRFEVEMQAMREALEAHNGVLVIFYDLQERRRFLPSEYDLTASLPLERVTRWRKEGAYYRIK